MIAHPRESRTRGIGVWRSLVAHLLWEQDVGSSNLSTPTKREGFAVARCLSGVCMQHAGILIVRAPVAQLDRASAF